VDRPSLIDKEPVWKDGALDGPVKGDIIRG
jgi:hypothetical protein